MICWQILEEYLGVSLQFKLVCENLTKKLQQYHICNQCVQLYAVLKLKNYITKKNHKN